MDKEFIVSCVKLVRKEQEITQEELADKVGVTRQTIIAIEGGNYTPSVLLAIKIAEVLKHPVEEIFGISNKKTVCTPQSLKKQLH